MANSHDSGVVERPDGMKLAEDTSLIPWPTFAIAAAKRYKLEVGMMAGALMIPAVIIAGVVALIAPQFALQTLPLLFVVYAGVTYLSDKLFTRVVFVIRQEHGRAVLDEQRWWREDERRIPDVYKKDDQAIGRPTAYLYELDGEVYAFNAWEDPLVVNANTVTAGHVAGIRTTATAAENIARHQESDANDVARYGLMVVIIMAGLLAIYLAGSGAIDAFTSTPIGTGDPGQPAP